MNRADMVNQKDQQEWSNYYGRQGLSVYFTDANAGKGITKVPLLTFFPNLGRLRYQASRQQPCTAAKTGCAL